LERAGAVREHRIQLPHSELRLEHGACFLFGRKPHLRRELCQALTQPKLETLQLSVELGLLRVVVRLVGNDAIR